MARRRTTIGAWAALLLSVLAPLAVAPGPSSGAVAPEGRTARHPACNEGPTRPCRFSNPGDTVRCLWTPTPNSVTCELVKTGRAYRLRPTGRAKSVRTRFAHRGETLPTTQTVVFPEKLSCRDTRVTMTCNQDEGFGEFKLALHASHAT